MEFMDKDIPSTTFSAKPYSLRHELRERKVNREEVEEVLSNRLEEFKSHIYDFQDVLLKHFSGHCELCGKRKVNWSQSDRNNSSTHLCPDAVAIGDGPLGGRGSSQVLISISTLSRD